MQCKLFLWIESLNSDVQQFHQYQQANYHDICQ
jgi:hypothetical protein